MARSFFSSRTILVALNKDGVFGSLWAHSYFPPSFSSEDARNSCDSLIYSRQHTSRLNKTHTHTHTHNTPKVE